MLTKRLLIPLAAALLVATGCDHRSPLAPQSSDQSPAARSAIAGRATWTGEAQHVEGSTGPGALYAFDVPESWNGNLVVYAHGYDEDAGPIELPDIAYLRDPLLARGYAVAVSSFSENGYALKEGVQQTHQLRGLFAARFGPPTRVYLVGQSLGGIIALKLAETYPEIYSGALLGCGVLGGTRKEIEYIANVRVLFDVFYEGVLDGTLVEVPEGVSFQTQVPKILQAMTADPSGALHIACLLNIPFNNPQELFGTIIQVLGFQWIGAADFLNRSHGHVFFDNQDVVYAAPCVPQDVLDRVNASVARYQIAPDAARFMEQHYEPDGNLDIPTVTLHTTRDPLVPFWHEVLYGQRVAEAGKSHLLKQKNVVLFGHCTYAPADLVAAFDELTAWVENPAP